MPKKIKPVFNKDNNYFLQVPENLIKYFPGTKSLYQPNKGRSYTGAREVSMYQMVLSFWYHIHQLLDVN